MVAARAIASAGVRKPISLVSTLGGSTAAQGAAGDESRIDGDLKQSAPRPDLRFTDEVGIPPGRRSASQPWMSSGCNPVELAAPEGAEEYELSRS
jgi:hypothetical protein